MLLVGGCTRKYLEAMMTNAFDENTYSDLLAKIAPRAIETKEEYNRLLAELDRLSFPKELTSEEMISYNLLVILTRFYEAEKRQIYKSDGTESKVIRLTESQTKSLSDYFNLPRNCFFVE